DSYIANPELVAEQRAAGLIELESILVNYFPTLIVDSVNGQRSTVNQEAPLPLHRVECYDISNLAGQQAVGSMVVFEDGEPLKRDYRKFRIKRDNVPNDTAMMAEVLRRRFKRLQGAGVRGEGIADDT